MNEGPAPSSARKSGRLKVGWLLRLAGSAAVLALIFHFVPVHEVWREARRLSPALWAAGLALFLLGHAAAAAKWRLLIGPGVSFGEALRAHLAGLAANLCLPSVAGGDVVRAGLVYRQAEDPARLAAGSVADRLLDTFGLAMIATLGGLLAFGIGGPGRPALTLAAAVAVAGVAALLLAVTISRRLAGANPFPGKFARMLNSVLRAAAELARRPGRLLACLGMSLVIQAVFIMINIAFALAAGVKAPAAAWFFAWAAAKIIAIAPVSLGGLGVREASMAGLLAPFGADPAQVVAIGLVWQTLLYVSGLLGLAVQFAWNPAARRTRAAPLAPSPERSA